MKLKLIKKMAISVLALLVTAQVARADGVARFSNRSLNGAFGCGVLGLLLTDPNSPPGLPLAAVVRYVFDGRSKVSGSIILQVDGLDCRYTLTGTYNIDPTGVGTTSVTNFPSAGDDPACGPSTGSPDATAFVIGDDGVPFYSMNTINALTGRCIPQ